MTAAGLAAACDCKQETVRKSTAEMADIDSYKGPHGKLTYFVRGGES